MWLTSNTKNNRSSKWCLRKVKAVVLELCRGVILKSDHGDDDDDGDDERHHDDDEGDNEPEETDSSSNIVLY